MTRLIDADKLYPDCLTKDGTLAISQSQIANAPTIDPIFGLFKTPHGKWIHGTRLDGSKYCRCSECAELAGCDYDGNHEESDYCPKCGAKMDGGADDDK